MDAVGAIIAELEEDPDRFRETDGYGRLVDLLREGHAPDALKRALLEGEEFVGDLFWSVVELRNVEPYVLEAAQCIASPDKATAAYATEVVLRGSHDDAQLRAALENLRSSDVAVCEHAVRTLAGEGLNRAAEVFAGAGWNWGVAIIDDLYRSPLSPEVVEELVSDTVRDRQIVGLVLASLAVEGDRSIADALKRSTQAWIRDYGEWLVEEPR